MEIVFVQWYGVLKYVDIDFFGNQKYRIWWESIGHKVYFHSTVLLKLFQRWDHIFISMETYSTNNSFFFVEFVTFTEISETSN